MVFLHYNSITLATDESKHSKTALIYMCDIKEACKLLISEQSSVKLRSIQAGVNEILSITTDLPLNNHTLTIEWHETFVSDE